MAKKAFPKFQGKPLIEIPAVVPTANFLVGEFGEAVYEAHKTTLESYHGKAREALDVLDFRDRELIGSNSYVIASIGQSEIFKELGLHTATPADIGRILEVGALLLEGQYVDLGLVYRSDEDPNGYVAKDVSAQLRELRSEVKSPVMLTGLGLRADDKARDGLAFVVNENTQSIYAPQLSGENDGKSFSETDENGLPVFDENGDRTNYAIDEGLSWLGLGRDLDLYSGRDWDDLSDSNSDGRVVAVGGGAASADFEARLKDEFNTQRKALESKYQAALKVLRN